MNIENNRTRLTAMAAGLTIVVGVGGVMIGRTLAPEQPALPQTTEAKAEEANGPEGFVAMDAARAAAAGIVSETTIASPLGGEILAQGVVAATPEGEAALTARADGAVVRINKRLGDYVRAGETVALLESREAAAIVAERSTASAKATAARSAYAREKRLYDARVTARQDLEAAQANLRETEAELRRTQGAAAAAKVSGGGRYLAVPSLISGRITKVSTSLGAYVLAGTELFRVADPSRIQINAAILPADARRIQPGDTATLELPGGETRTATVRSATPSLDPESRTATVVLVPDGVGGLTPGQGLRVRIKPRGAPVGSGVALPDEAVQTVEGRDVVFVRTSKGFRATPVTIGQRGAGRIEIVAGIKPGAVVATKGAFLLKAELGKSEAGE